jgi:hypothetical protein
MEEKLLADLKKAMKENNAIEKSTIQYIRAQILKLKKDKQATVTDEDIENILVQERKKRYEALALFEKGNRQDLMETTYKEIACINRYLPQPLSNVEIEEELKNIISELNADKSMFGQVMGTAKAKLGSRADGKIMSDILKQLLV